MQKRSVAAQKPASSRKVQKKVWEFFRSGLYPRAETPNQGERYGQRSTTPHLLVIARRCRAGTSSSPYFRLVSKAFPMHPPFYTPDTSVSRDITPFSGRPIKRRGEKPQRLVILPFTGWPPVAPPPLDPVPLSDHVAPGRQPIVLVVVPAPRSTWRDIMGRFLIRTGQRMILRNGPG